MTSHNPGNHGSQPLGEMIRKLMVEHESFTYRKHCIRIHLLIRGKEEHLYVFWSICSCEMWKSCSTRVVVPSFTISISCKTCCQNIKYITHSNTGRCFNTIFAIPSNENDSWPVVAPGIWKALLLYITCSVIYIKAHNSVFQVSIPTILGSA